MRRSSVYSRKEGLYRVERLDKDTFKASEMLLLVSRVWLFLGVGALLLYFVVLAIEQHKSSVLVVGYRVPIEREEGENVGNSG